MAEQRYIYKVSVFLNEKPKLYKSLIIKETPKCYLCETGPATKYGSRVFKESNPSLSPIEAWQAYLKKAHEVLISLSRRTCQQVDWVDYATEELTRLECNAA